MNAGLGRKIGAALAGVALAAMPLATSAQEGRTPGGIVGPINAIAPDWPETVEMMRILRPNWEKLGIKVNVQHAALNTVFAQAVSDRSAPHMTAMGWGGAPDRIDPDFFLTELLHSKRAVKGGFNYGNFKNAEYDALVDAQRAEMDPVKRVALIKKAQEVVYRELPGLTLYYSDYINPYRKDRIEGVVPVMGSGISLAYIPWTYYQGKPKTNRKFVRATTQYDIATLNPFATGEVQNSSMLRWIYAPFIMRDANLKPVPWAAESWKVIDGQTVDVTIRAGMKFNDGKPVTVEDVKFTFDFIAEWKFPSFARFYDNIDSVEITGERSVRFKLKQPYSPFVTNILGYAFIAPKHVWEKVGQDKSLKSPADWPNDNPVGYGPFKLAEWKKNAVLRMQANADWFQPPHFSDVYWLIVPAIDSQLGMLQNGEADIMAWTLTPSQIKRLADSPTIEAKSAPSHAPRDLRFNLVLAPFDDLAFRQAIAFSTDRKQLVNTLLDGAGTPGNDTFLSPKLPEANTALEVREFSIEKARGILQAAGYTWDSEGRLRYPK